MKINHVNTWMGLLAAMFVALPSVAQVGSSFSDLQVVALPSDDLNVVQVSPTIPDFGVVVPTDDPKDAQAGPSFPDLPVVELPYDDLKHWAIALPLMYEGRRWELRDEVMAQACHGPSDAGYSGQGASLLRVINAQGKIVRERRVGNPRIILPEAPGGKDGWKPAEFVEATLIVGLAKDAYLVQFFEDADRPKEPAFEVDIRRAVDLAATLAKKMKPACQGNNPPVVPLGTDGGYVLAYALQHAANTVGLPASEFHKLLEAYPVMWQLRRKLPKPLTVQVQALLGHAKVVRD